MEIPANTNPALSVFSATGRGPESFKLLFPV